MRRLEMSSSLSFGLVFIGFGFGVGRRFSTAVDVLAAQRIADMADQIGFAAFKSAVFVFDFNVRNNALRLNRAVVWRSKGQWSV